jgi:histidinol-phosphate aminotransferase
MDNLQPVHGSTDAGASPQFDFSSNANAIGASPVVVRALRAVDPTHYPDPFYVQLHQSIADFHQVNSDQVAVGAGASELIVRLTRWERSRGPVLTLNPTFSEYARSARLASLSLREAKSQDEFLGHLRSVRLAFLCLPNNPTGVIYDADFLNQVAETAQKSGTIVVADLAYQALTAAEIVIPPSFWRMYAPNKAHGVTGIRAGYLVAPEGIGAFRNVAPSWIVSVHGEAFLRSALTPKGQAWVRKCCPTLWAWRDRLQAQIATLGLRQSWGQANFGLVNVGNAAEVTQALRSRSIRVRDCTSFGLPSWVRLSAQPEVAQDALVQALTELNVVGDGN